VGPDKVDLRKEVEAKIIKHAEGSLIDLGGSLVNYCLSFIQAHREEWYEAGYSVGYHDRGVEDERE
jgi:hypothetical protein